MNIAIDIGASKIAYTALFDGREVNHKLEIGKTETAESVFQRLQINFENLLDKNTLAKTIAVSSAANIDKLGVIVGWPNRSDWIGINIIHWLKQFVTEKIFWCDDGIAGTIADSNTLAGNYLHLCLGTGFGGGLIYNGRLVGESELGHLVVQANGRSCVCGLSGCIQAYVSVGSYRKYLEENNGKDEYQLTQQWLSDAIEYTAAYLNNMCRFFNIKHVSFSGGLTNIFPNFISSVSKSLETMYGINKQSGLVLQQSPYKDNASLHGVKLIASQGVTDRLVCSNNGTPSVQCFDLRIRSIEDHKRDIPNVGNYG